MYCLHNLQEPQLHNTPDVPELRQMLFFYCQHLFRSYILVYRTITVIENDIFLRNLLCHITTKVYIWNKNIFLFGSPFTIFTALAEVTQISEYVLSSPVELI